MKVQPSTRPELFVFSGRFFLTPLLRANPQLGSEHSGSTGSPFNKGEHQWVYLASQSPSVILCNEVWCVGCLRVEMKQCAGTWDTVS